MRIMDVMLSRYLSKRDLRAAVILRAERNSIDWIMPEVGLSEEDYYKSIYSNKLEIIEVDFSERNIYPVMQSSDVIVAGFGTTCLIEAFSVGKKFFMQILLVQISIMLISVQKLFFQELMKIIVCLRKD